MESVSHRLHPPPRPPHPFSSAIRLYVFSLLTCIVLPAEVKALDILMLLFKQATTFPRACFRNTMKYIILLFSFFHFFVDCSSMVCGSCAEPLAGDPGCFFFSSSFSLFPDVTLAPMLNPPPTQPLSPLHPSLQPRQTLSFYPGGLVPGIAPKQATFNAI